MLEAHVTFINTQNIRVILYDKITVITLQNDKFIFENKIIVFRIEKIKTPKNENVLLAEKSFHLKYLTYNLYIELLSISVNVFNIYIYMSVFPILSNNSHL